MLDKFFTNRFFRIWLFILFPLGAYAQLRITSPVERSVYQREIGGEATISVTGNYAIAMDKIEVRAIPVIEGQGRPDKGWELLQENPTGGVFNGTLRLFGGWYTLVVRGSKNGQIVGQTAVVSRMGVGEVFVVAGQSNAQGIVYNSPPATDDRVNYVNWDNNGKDILTDPPYPTFERLDSRIVTMGPRGKGPWCWGILGDLLTQRLNVPVLFLNTGWEGTSIKNWRLSSENKRTTSIYDPGFVYPAQMPYANLKISMQHIAKEFGVRAILWMQGETDNTPAAMSSAEYRDHLTFLLGKLGSDIDSRVTWVISRTSRAADPSGRSVTSQAIIDAQNSVINALFSSAYAGPETDNLYVERADGTHFVGGESILANAWNNSLNTNFFATVSPLLPTQVPKITSVCAPNNTSLTLTLPDGFASYVWSGGQTSKSITVTSAGEYSATLKDAFGNAVHSQKLIVESSIKPVTPIIVQAGAQQACADIPFVFSTNASNDANSWYNEGSTTVLGTGPTFAASTAGSYTVRTQNVFGCISDISAPASLIIRPAIPTPVVSKSGPFTAMATVAETGLTYQYDWRRDQKDLLSHVNIVKTDTTGDYTARSKSTFILGSNSLTCYSPFSEPFIFVTDENDNVVIFPNPAEREEIYVESRADMENVDIIVYDLFGRIVVTQNQALKSRVRIQVQNLPSGKYIVRIKSKEVDLNKQIVIR